ncbi:MAG TPA: glycosyltransferase family 39 protein [Tepidisphaeraceae bacterium]|jgi:4-amino-4-deoxy-L-arabinose transferase-like glycosyltransferase|nr:glycosyltransferase family 39 protein [Tepidisphaeraceae bacterium]
MHPPPGTNSSNPPRRWLAALIVLLAAVHFYCPPGRVAELEVVPDSVEYAVAGHEFATSGKYQIHVNGRALPPRYPPGFSVIFLAPVYAIAPRSIGNGIFAVWLAGIIAALFAYLIGEKLAGPWGGVFAAVLLMHHAQIAAYTQVIMTDMPAVAMALIACWIFLHLAERSAPPVRLYLCAGVVCALAISIRPLTGLLLVPFLFDIFRRRRDAMWRDLLALGVPCALVIVGTALYQWHAFGDWRRTGYQFWLAVPYDYASLTFSPRYFGFNFEIVRKDPLILLPILFGLLGTISLWRKRAAGVAPIVQFLVLAIIPLSLVHLVYFFRDIRFHFPLISLLLVLAGAGIAVLIPEHLRRKFWFALPLLALMILLPRIGENPLEEGPAIRHHVATAAAELLPANAVLISRIDPAYLEQMVCRGTSRRVIPLDRQTPYASAVIAFRRIALLTPPPRNAADHACAGLVNGGAEKLYAATADEEIGQLKAWVGAGVPVYLDTLSAGLEEKSRAMIGKAFRLESVSNAEPWLVRLALRE